MPAIALGPLLLPANVLAFALALAVAALVGWASARWLRGESPLGALADVVLAGVLAARVVFVALWFDRYRASPVDVLALGDGGFTTWAGIVAGLAVGAWRAWRRPALRRPLGLALLAGLGLWVTTPGLVRVGGGPALGELSAHPLATPGAAATPLPALAAGRPAVVNLWATWCPPCRREMPALQAAARVRPDVAFVFADQAEDAATVRAFLASQGLSADGVALDPTSALGRAARSPGLPTTLFYDARGRLVDSHVGALTDAALAARLADLDRAAGRR